MFWLKELRLAPRTLTKNPEFLTLALATLALGIATTTVLFSVTESVLWRPLPFPRSERLVRIYEQNLKRAWQSGAVSPANFRDWRDRIKTIHGLAASTWNENRNLTGLGVTERVKIKKVSAGFLETLGVQTARGRMFRRDEEQPGKDRVALLTDAFWKRVLKGSAASLGATIKLDGESYTVVGILPAEFHLEFVADPDLYLPLTLGAAEISRDDRLLAVIGQIADGKTRAQAAGEMDALGRRWAAEFPATNANWVVVVENLRDSFTRFYRRELFLFLGFAAFVLLIACANVAGLQLVRFVGRQKEFALRTALGANRAAIFRQSIAENLWIAIPGGALGAILAAWGIEGLRKILPPDKLARTNQISMDWTALAFVLSISLATTLAFALAPLLLSSRLDLDATLRDWGKSIGGSRGTRRSINTLIAGEVALGFVLLFGAALFISSYERLQQVSLGFDPRDLFTVRIAMGKAQGANPAGIRAFYGQVLQKAASTGGVREVALVRDLPLDSAYRVDFVVEGRPRPEHGAELDSIARIITPNYFHVMSIPLLRGRAFTQSDSAAAAHVAIINENLAHNVFGDQDPLGKVLEVLPGGDASVAPGPVRIVGLAANTKEVGLNEVKFNDIYLPFAQHPARSMFVVAKMHGRDVAIAASLRRELQALDPDEAIYNLATMEERIHDSLNGARFNLTLVAVFAGLAALLASVGVYGAISFSVAQRRREFGLRMALGALPRAIVRLTLKHSIALTAAGAICGLAAAALLGVVLKEALYLAPGKHTGLIYGVGVHDPVSFACAAGVLLSLAAIAGLAPANRAARVDPLAALRHE